MTSNTCLVFISSIWRMSVPNFIIIIIIIMCFATYWLNNYNQLNTHMLISIEWYFIRTIIISMSLVHFILLPSSTPRGAYMHAAIRRNDIVIPSTISNMGPSNHLWLAWPWQVRVQALPKGLRGENIDQQRARLELPTFQLTAWPLYLVS